MRFQCHGCERTVQVRGDPPAGARVKVTCPLCGAVNRATVPSPAERLLDAQERFMDFIRKTMEGKQ